MAIKKLKSTRTPGKFKIPAEGRHRLLPIVILAALAVFIAALRRHTYNEPFERDITSHAVIAHEMLAGRSLYSDLWDSKPPAIFLTYALGDILAGYGPAEVYFIGVVLAIITMIGCYRAGSALGGIAGGLWAAAFWAIICSDLWLWANQPNIEVAINASLVWAFALMVRADTNKLQPVRWLAVGGLFALATLYKQVAIVFPAFIGLFYLLTSLGNRRTAKLAFLQVCIMAAAGVAIWAAVFAYFAFTDRFEVFYDTIFTYSRWYAKSRGGNFLSNLAGGLSYGYFARAMKSTPVLVVIATAGAIYGLVNGPRRSWLLLVAFLIGAYFAVCLPGRYYNHYYQLFLGPLVIGAGWAVSTKNSKLKTQNLKLKAAAGAVGLIILLCSVLPQYGKSADEWSANKQGPQYIIEKSVAKELDALLEPDESLYVLGINPGFYFWSGRRPPTGVIWSTDLANNPLAEEHTRRALADLQREKPEIFVINMLHAQVPLDHPVVKWAQENYIPLPGSPDRGVLYGRPFFRVFIRRGGRLAEPRNKLRG